MSKTSVNVSAPRLVTDEGFAATGLAQRMYPGDGRTGASLWQAFAPHMGHIPGQKPGRASYGICSDFRPDRSIQYMAAVEVADRASVPDGLTHMVLAPQTYAVVFVSDHISNVAAAWGHTFEHILPNAGYKVAAAPSFERYDERFDPMTGNGGYEIWIPIVS